MKKVIFIVFFVFSYAQAQPVATAEQLLERSQDPNQAIAVAMYLSGLRDAASAGLIRSAEHLRESGGETGQSADYEEALGLCLGRLEVADMIQKLRQMQADGAINPGRNTAAEALLDGAEDLCREDINAALLAGN